MIAKIIKYLKNPKLILYKLDCLGIIRLNDKLFLKIQYYLFMDEELNLDNPRTFNEKMQWLKLYNRKDIYTKMVDKYEVKKYVSNIIGEKYIVPTISIYDSFNDIDFEKLPNKFVIKCTHDSGGLVIVKDKSKLDRNKARKKINKCLKKNFYYYGREWPYKNVKPRIIIEKYMEDNRTNELRDYKFFCFNGHVKFFKVDFNRFVSHQANYYDRNLKLLKFGEKICPPDFNKKIEIPDNITEMINLAEKLSNDNPFMRVDFYSCNSKIYFGEITFFPGSGLGKFIPEKWDYKLGELLKLPSIDGR